MRSGHQAGAGLEQPPTGPDPTPCRDPPCRIFGKGPRLSRCLRLCPQQLLRGCPAGRPTDQWADSPQDGACAGLNIVTTPTRPPRGPPARRRELPRGALGLGRAPTLRTGATAPLSLMVHASTRLHASAIFTQPGLQASPYPCSSYFSLSSLTSVRTLRSCAQPSLLTLTAAGPQLSSHGADWQSYLSYGIRTAALVSVRYKIRGCQPSQVAPGWQRRLARLARRADTTLAGCYVRAGCVELTLDLVVSASAGVAAGPGGSHRAGQGYALDPAPIISALGLEGCVGRDSVESHRAGVTSGDDSGQLRGHRAAIGRPGAVELPVSPTPLAAEEEERREEADGSEETVSTAGRGRGSDPWVDNVQVQVLGLEAATPDAPTVMQVQPRVLVLPPPPPSEGPVLAPAVVQPAEAAAAVPAAATLSLSSHAASEFHVQAVVRQGCRSSGVCRCGCRCNGRRCSNSTDATGSTFGASARSAGAVIALPLPAPSVLARGNSVLLAARVLQFGPVRHQAVDNEAAAAGGGGSDGAAVGCPSCCVCGDSAGRRHGYYILEVAVEMPCRPGILLLEFSWGPGPGELVPVVVLPAAQAAVAAEIAALTSPLPQSQLQLHNGADPAGEAAVHHDSTDPASRGAVLPSTEQTHGSFGRTDSASTQANSTSSGPTGVERSPALEGLLVDLAIWAQIQGSVVEGDEAEGLPSHTAVGSVPGLLPRLPLEQQTVLGSNLLRFAAQVGLTETSAWLHAGLASIVARQLMASGAAAAQVVTTTAVALLPASFADDPACGASPAYTATSKHGHTRPVEAHHSPVVPSQQLPRTAEACGTRQKELTGWRGWGSSGGSGGGPCCAALPVMSCSDGWLPSLWLVLDWAKATPAEEAAFREYVAPWTLQQEHIIQTFEFLAMLALLFRARANLFCPLNLITLLCNLSGSITAVSYMVLSRSAYETLVRRAKVPRYLCYMASKAVAVFSGQTLPPGYVSYQRGVAMILHEGVLLPLSCLVSFRTALTMAASKLGPCMALMLSSGASPTIRLAGQRCLAVAVVALITTTLCHIYIRQCFARVWRRRRSVGVGVGIGTVASGSSSKVT